MNNIKQHTAQWKNIKRFNLGANDIASLLGVGYSDPSTIIQHKIDGTEDEHDETTQQLLDRGTRYESVVRDLFQQRHNVKIKETGLKRYHAPYTYITASPDGYCTQNYKGVSGPFLTEFKVRKELSYKIPMKFWVQMQVQMAVWDIDRCVYCENVVVEQDGPGRDSDHGPEYEKLEWEGNYYYWQLKEFREQLVERDRQWWQSVLPKIQRYWGLVETGRGKAMTRSTRKRTAAEAGIGTSAETELKKRRIYLEEKENIIQPYMLGNYFRKDPLLDWLNLYGPMDRRDTEVNFFLSMIREKNRAFNDLVTQWISNRYPDSHYNVCPEPFKIPEDQSRYVELHKLGYTYEAVERTRAAMKRKVPIIFNPCFNVKMPSYPYPIGGRADMIVLNRDLGDLLGMRIVPSGPEDSYVIVNFKYATINLRADKVHLLNNNKQKVYKAHMWLLNMALGVEQGHTPTLGYLIGRKYDFKKRGVTYRVNNAFQGIGTVDFQDIDNSYEDDCRAALEWLEIVREPEAASWDPFRPETSADSRAAENMYPNMKNAMDYPWHQYKVEIATAIKDITLMYHCGPRVREYAHQMGVTEWNQLNPDSIVYNSGKLLDQIMSFVDTQARIPTSTPAPAFPQQAIDAIGRKGYINGRPCIEFYLDFEAIGNMYDDFSQFPEASSKAMIFLIGLIVVDNTTGQRNYVSYLIDRLDHEAEREMVQKMLDDMKAARERYGQDFAPVYFWSNAENYMLKRAMGDEVVHRNGLVMIDLCKAFRDTKLIVQGQMGYGLKDVAKTMYKHGMISTTWDESAEIASGLNATIEAFKTYTQRDAESRRQYFRSLIDYNYVDCKVMEEILEYLRMHK